MFLSGYNDNKSSSGYSVDYVKHDSTKKKNSNIYKAGVELTNDSGNVLSSGTEFLCRQSKLSGIAVNTNGLHCGFLPSFPPP